MNPNIPPDTLDNVAASLNNEIEVQHLGGRFFITRELNKDVQLRLSATAMYHLLEWAWSRADQIRALAQHEQEAE